MEKVPTKREEEGQEHILGKHSKPMGSPNGHDYVKAIESSRKQLILSNVVEEKRRLQNILIPYELEVSEKLRRVLHIIIVHLNLVTLSETGSLLMIKRLNTSSVVWYTVQCS